MEIMRFTAGVAVVPVLVHEDPCCLCVRAELAVHPFVVTLLPGAVVVVETVLCPARTVVALFVIRTGRRGTG